MQRVSERLWTPIGLWDSRRQNEALVSMSNHISSIVYKWPDNTEDYLMNAPPQPDVKSGSMHLCFVDDSLCYREDSWQRGQRQNGGSSYGRFSFTHSMSWLFCLLKSDNCGLDLNKYKNCLPVLEIKEQSKYICCIRHDKSQSGSYHENDWGYGFVDESRLLSIFASRVSFNKSLSSSNSSLFGHWASSGH